MPSMISLRLCGGMLVAMPTAMPVPPLMRRFGNAAGKTDRLGEPLVVVRDEIDRLLVQVIHQRASQAE